MRLQEKMVKITVVTCLILTIFGYKTEKNIINPITLLSFLWGLIVLLSSLRYCGLGEAPDKAYNWIMLGVVMFAAGYYILRHLSHNKIICFRVKKSRSTRDDIYSINYILCYICLIICLIYILYRISRYRTVILISGLKAIGTMISENQVSDSGIINAIGFLIVNPMYLALTVVTGVDYWLGKRDRKLMILTLIMTVGRIFISGGRQPFIQLFLIWIVGISFSIDKYKNNLYGKIKSTGNKKKLILIIICAVLVFYLLSVSKTDVITKTIYLDFSMQPYMLGKWAASINGKYAYGFASLFGVMHPILYVSKNLFHIFSDMPVFFSDIYNNIQDTFIIWVRIGDHLSANAYASAFWYLYYDAREAGIAIGMFIFGIVSYNTYISAMRRKNLKNVSIYIMIVICIIYTFTDMEFSKASYVLALVYLYVILFRKNSMIYERNR